MSTRCIIGYRTEKNTVIYSYCHFDGYPDGVGKKLIEHYNNAEAAKQIASLHGFSALEDTFEETKKNEYKDKTCSLYGEIPYKEWLSITNLFGAAYIYTWDNLWIITP